MWLPVITFKSDTQERVRSPDFHVKFNPEEQIQQQKLGEETAPESFPSCHHCHPAPIELAFPYTLILK